MNFLQLIQDGILVQGILTLAVWAAIIYLSVTGNDVPDILSTGGIAILAFYFGERSNIAVQKAIQKMTK